MIVRDSRGPFGSPFVDSVRTKVDEETRHLLHAVYFLHSGMGKDALQDMATTMQHFLGGDSGGYAIFE